MKDEMASEYVVVTGVSSGIGYATAAKLVEEGIHVLGTVRSEEDAVRVKAELGADFTPVMMDVTDEASIAAAVVKVKETVGEFGLVGLVNNAGIAVAGPLMHTPIADLRRQFDVNVFGLMAVTQAFLPLLGASEEYEYEPGRIVNLSSVSAHTVYPFVGPYAASKHAVEALSHALRRELIIYGIDVVLIVAGAVATPIWDKMTAEEVARYRDTDWAYSGERARKTVANLSTEGMSAVRVADTIFTALTTPKPKARYVLANDWLRGWYLPQKLPIRFIDNMMARGVGLTPPAYVDSDRDEEGAAD